MGRVLTETVTETVTTRWLKTKCPKCGRPVKARSQRRLDYQLMMHMVGFHRESLGLLKEVS